MRFTIQGQGGQLWWIDKNGNQPWSKIERFDFNLLPQRPDPQSPIEGVSGSFLLSEPIHLNGAQTLNLRATIATAAPYAGSWYQDVGFGLLLSKRKAKYTLFAIRPDNAPQFGDMGPGFPDMFASPTNPPVQCHTSPQQIQSPFIMGGIDYALGAAATSITVSCMAEIGEYQVLIGMFTRGGVDLERPSGILIWSVDVG